MAIADDLVGHAHVAYLGDPFEQYCGLNGKPLIGGCIEVYHAGTDTRYITMQNFDGAMNPFKVPLNADGRVVMLADPSLTYDMYVRNSYGDLVCSRLNVECTCPGNISINGSDTYVRNTDGTLDVSLRTLGDNVRQYTINTHNKVLDVQDPLYFVENSNTATVIGFSGDSSISISGKMDESKLEFNSNDEISAYNGSAFASQGGGGGAGDPAVNALVRSTSATWNNVSAKLDTTAFSTVSGSFLTAHQSLDGYATTEDVESATSGLQPSGDYYSASNPSGFITGVDLTPYQTTAGMTAYATTALVSSVSSELYSAFSSISGDFELVAGSGVELVDDTINKTTTINVTAQSVYSAATATFDKNGNDIAETYYPANNPSAFITGVNLSGISADLARMMGVDETEILNSTAANAFSLKEPLSAFNEIKVKLRWWDKVPDCYYNVERFSTAKMSLSWTYFDNVSDPSPLEFAGASWTSTNGIDYTLEAGYARIFSTATTAQVNFTHSAYPISIYGVGRKQ